MYLSHGTVIYVIQTHTMKIIADDLFRTKQDVNPTPNTHKGEWWRDEKFPNCLSTWWETIEGGQFAVLERMNVMNVMGIAGNAFGIFSHGKHVLAQVNDCDV